MTKEIKNVSETERRIYNTLLFNVRLMEEDVINGLLSGEQSLLIGEGDDIDSFLHYISDNGIDIAKDIGYLVIGYDKENLRPVTITKVNRETGEFKILQICMIRKSDILINLMTQDAKDNLEKRLDSKKLIVIELETADNGSEILSRFLGKDEELNIENIKRITRKYFNVDKTFASIVEQYRREMDVERSMYV